MEYFWFSKPIQTPMDDGSRSWLDSFEISDWSTKAADDTHKRCLWIRRSQRGTFYFNTREALEVALTRPDIDAISIEADCFRQEEQLRDLVRRLLSQDRDWKARVGLYKVPDVQECLDILALFKSARYLSLDTFDQRMLPLLNSFPNLVELELGCLSYSQIFPLFEDESLAGKMRNVDIVLTSDDGDPAWFPAAAKKHWRSLVLTLDQGYCPASFLDLSHHVSQLESLKYFKLDFFLCDEFFDSSDAIQTLSTWLSSPSCALSHLSIGGEDCTYRLPLASSLKLIRGICLNRSIQELSVTCLSDDLNWSSEVLPEFAKSSVHHLLLSCDSSLGPKMLREWMRQMLPARLITIHLLSTWDEAFSEVSNLHISWKGIWQSSQQPGEPTGPPNCFFLTRLPPCLWVRALGRLGLVIGYRLTGIPSKTVKVILDMTFFLLQHWLASFSVIPSPILPEQQRSSSPLYYEPGIC